MTQRGSSPETSEIKIPIPDELIGQDIDIKAVDNETKLAASQVTGLTVKDSNNTVTGTVAANTSTSPRSCTITLTNGGKSNLSLASPYSFTLTQSGKVEYKGVDITYVNNFGSNSSSITECIIYVDGDYHNDLWAWSQFQSNGGKVTITYYSTDKSSIDLTVKYRMNGVERTGICSPSRITLSKSPYTKITVDVMK